ncbi:MAG: ATP-dependent helicase/deoxyribonuclease subunit B [Firmicutes bacterium]|nr:ATP-dependent helicase/deoxyribonuclease subunit B [candidate division NPL-UPA2 bacterium]
MSLRLVLGRASSGKSLFFYQEITAEVEKDALGAPIWVLVPEQSTFQVERALCDRLGGLMRVRVVSFQRLAHIVMNAVAGAALTPIGDLGRLMLMRKVIEEHKSKLRLFSRAAGQPGFAAKVVELVSELKRYRVRPADLEMALQTSLPSALSNKLHDLHLLYSALTEKYGGISLDSDDRLEWLTEHIGSFAALRGTQLYIDGFTGFTPQEYGVLGHLLRMTDVSLALTLEPGLLGADLDVSHPFFAPWETAKHCSQLARRQGQAVNVATLHPQQKYSAQNSLTFLESSYFDLFALPSRDESRELRLVAAENRRVEVEYIAREIIALCRESNFRYRDISVVTRDLNLYEPLLAEIFPAYDIPYFLDKKRAVRHHPLLDLVKSALEAVEQNFPYEPTLRCLKTDLWPIARDTVDRIDNFALAVGLCGRHWTGEDDWFSLRQDEESTLNEARRGIASLFAPVAERLTTAKTVSERAQAVVAFLDALKVEDSLSQWASSCEASGRIENARLHVQVMAAVDQLFAELMATLGSEELTLSDFTRIVESGLEGIVLGLIPPCLDQVPVLELGRSRGYATPVSFLMGVNDGLLPARPSVQGLLTDEESALLSACEIRLGPTAHRQLFEEEFLVYIGLTRATERLTLSYSLANEAGGAMRPSSVIRRLQYLFPEQQLTFAAAEAPRHPEDALSCLAHPNSAAEHLAAELGRAKAGGEVSDLWLDVYTFLAQDVRSRHLVEILARGLRHRVGLARLPRSLVNRLYGTVLRGSVSRLEKFRACPFAHFARYGLGLRERPMYKLASVDIGNFFHLALDRFASHMRDKHMDWAEMTRAECKGIAAGVVAGLVPTMGILSSNARHKYLTTRLQQVVERSARIMGEHAKRGKFRPVALELGFGLPEDRLPAVKLTLSDGTIMELSGRIDRVDAASDQETLYVAVVDYKSGHNKLTPLEVYYGLRTQLLTYLSVVLRLAPEFLGQTALPAAALYFRVQDPILSSSMPLSLEDAEQQSRKEFRFQGVVVADKTVVSLLDHSAGDESSIVPVKITGKGDISGVSAWTTEQLEAMLAHLEDCLRQAGEEIVAGEVAALPYRLAKDTACTFCEFLPVCQFDLRQPDSQYRQLEKHDPEEVWSRLAEKGGSLRG